MNAHDDGTSVAQVRLEAESPLPKYQQIVEQVKAHVANGRLVSGAPLPSVRQLAGDLGVNVNTVIAAYRALDAEGVIRLRHGSRARVRPRHSGPTAPPPDEVARVRALLERVRTEARLAGLSLDALRELAREVFADTSDDVGDLPAPIDSGTMPCAGSEARQ